jgi:hypothetical protein
LQQYMYLVAKSLTTIIFQVNIDNLVKNQNYQYFELTKIWILINVKGFVVTFCIYFLFERNKAVNWQMKDAQIGNYLGK